jgi:hypothetical protein
MRSCNINLECMTTMTTFVQHIRTGLKHRLICSVPLLLASPLFLFEYYRSSALLDLAPVAGALLGSTLAFMQPRILTEGWNRPFPNSNNLRIGTKRDGRMLSLLSIGLFVLPALTRLALSPAQ